MNSTNQSSNVKQKKAINLKGRGRPKNKKGRKRAKFTMKKRMQN